MRKLIVLVGVVLLLTLALTAYVSSTGPSGGIEAQGSASTFSGTLQEPEINTLPVESSGATFGGSFEEPR